jgi:3-hydroxymyristoyl/3-hydroxydecanoyl-(acyl carrier protein) dehydratase
MDHHFRAFSFVDRITSVQPGAHIRGEYAIPAGISEFPASLVAESVGQLAAWVAMSAFNFERRPLAGLAGTIELLAPAAPGQRLELSADIESIEEDALAYHGTAQSDGVTLIRLRDCVGPMVGVTDFDDPQLLRQRFAQLCDSGAEPGAFGGVPTIELKRQTGEPGQRARATLRVPDSAPLFGDHFPRRPVFPGTLLMHNNLQLAAWLAAELPPPAAGGAWSIRTVSDVKLRAFIPPGDTLELEARPAQTAPDAVVIALETRKGGRIVGGARVGLAPANQP